MQGRRRRSKKKTVSSLKIPEMPSFDSPVSFDVANDQDFQEILARFEHQATQDTETAPVIQADDMEEDIPEEIDVSKRQVRRFGRPTVAMLKSVSRRPELIEPHDTDAPDPFTLAEIKNTRNAVPIPQHWAQKRKYLNYKKGSEMSRYRLPDYLERTGIGKMRQALREMDEKKSLQQRQRDRARPKLGMMDIPPALLYDAFYKHQTKPIMSRFGDMYFENKELMPTSRNLHPGKLSQRLRDALGMVDNAPPPWLFKMQRYGPPPSYPNLKIPGLNAPLPPGAEWGDHLGGWGQVPLTDAGTPVWGGNPFAAVQEEEPEETQLWGIMSD